MTSRWRYSSLLAALLLPVSVAQADELQAKQYADFDSYVLALSGKPDFVRANTREIVKSPTNVVCKKRARTKQIS